MTDSSGEKRSKGRSLGDFPPEEFSPADKVLLENCSTGEPTHIGDVRPDKPSKVNRISAGFLRFLALGGDARAPVHEKGIQIEGAWIEGGIDFEGCALPHRISLRSCTIDGPLMLRDAQLVSLDLESTSVRGIIGNRVRCSGTVLLWRNFHASGTVQLSGARIDGNFDCEGGCFEDNDIALDCDSAQIGGRAFLNKGFEARGAVQFRVATVAKGFDCRGGSFAHSIGTALNCTRMEVGGSVFFGEGFCSKGEVQLIGVPSLGW
jgi:hypothetical protein